MTFSGTTIPVLSPVAVTVAPNVALAGSPAFRAPLLLAGELQ